MKTGLHSISNEDYHNDPAISASHLHAAARSPKTYYKRYVDPKAPLSSPTAAMQLGTLVHSAVLEPEDFARRYAFSTARKGSSEYEALIERGITPVSKAQWDQALGMRDSVLEHPEVSWLLSEGKAEQSLWWTDEETQQLCKCRPDWWNGDIVVDLKTTQDASPRGFALSVAKFRYHVQQMHYLQGTQAARFIFVAVEKEFPYEVGVYELDEEACGIGEKLRIRDMKRIKLCRERDSWPGYSTYTMPLPLPDYAKTVIYTASDF